ncbi:MAG: ORC1-type DNA replication protein [Halobacteriales archaeon]
MRDGPEGDMLGWDESVFRDERVLDADYVPETFKHRETQMSNLQYCLRPAVRGARPVNAIIRGPPGTGKTTAILKLHDQLEAHADVYSVRVNCQVNSTRYTVFAKIYEAILDLVPPSSGKAFKELFGQVADHLIDTERVLVVALDDVNYLYYDNEASDALYSLLRAHEEYPGAKIGVMVVSSDPDLDVIGGLDNRVQSVFHPEEVYFPVYDEPEIVDILEERVRRGFYEGAVPEEALHRVAALTAETGDLRVGIDLLHRAGLNAEIRASRELAVEDVEEAYETSKYVHLSRSLRTLGENERALLRVVASHEGEQAGPIYDAFHEVTGLGYTRYSEIVNKLDNLGVLRAEYADLDGRGRSRRLTLAYDADAVIERLEG